MAYYNTTTVRYRGRLLYVTLRYGAFISAEVGQGKPLKLSQRDEIRIDQLIDRQRPEARKCHDE